MIKNKFNNSVSLLKNAINNDKLVIFAGAGVSKDSGIPLWNELLNEIKDNLNEEIIENDPLKIAQILYNEKGEKEYNDIIKKSLFKNKSSYNPLHEIIFELNPQHIITTNYDDFFEDIIKNKGLPFSVVSKDIDLPYAEHKNLLIKYHGDFDNKNIILKESDYLEFSKNNTLKEIFVKSLFSNKVILFVGYSVGDINLKLLIREIQFILTKHHQRAYLLTHKNEISDSEIKYFENLGINIVHHCEETLKNLSENDKLSSIGKITHKQLSHIRDFDLFEYQRNINSQSSKSRIIDDLYTSLRRFYYFRVIPKNLIASLYPLSKNSPGDTIYNIESNTLICYNNELYELLKSYNGENDLEFSDEEKKKLNFSLGRLIYSNIYSIGQKTGKKDGLGSQRTANEIDLFEKHIETTGNCDCIDCTISRYEYGAAILKIEKYEITENSELWDDLVYAYSLYQMNEFYKSYTSYEQIEIKANKAKQMDVSFVSKYNMKRIGLRIQSLLILDHRYSFDDLKTIENSAKKIDLDKELTKVKYFVDNDVYILLREIRDGIYIQRLCNEIDDLYNKIPKDIKIIENGGTVNNSDYSNLYNVVKRLNDFLKGSFIIGNGFSSIEYSINKSIKTFILGFYINILKLDSQQKMFGVSKVDSFNHYLFELIINYNNPKDLVEFIKEKGIYNIKIDEESQKSVSEYVSNFFKSSYDTNTYFNNKEENKVYTNYVNYNIQFRKKIIKEFKNICIILNYFEFNENQLKAVYSDLNQFIKFIHFDEHDEFIYLKSLINLKHEQIGYELLLETLNVFNLKNRYDSIYVLLLRKLKDLNIEFVNEKFNIDKLDFEKTNYELPLIYDTLPKEIKKIFLVKTEKFLINDNDITNVFVLLRNNIPLKKETKEKYIQSIHKKLEVKRNFTKEEYSSYYLFVPITQYFHLIDLGIIKDKQLLSLNVEAEIFKFIIDPENFDENKFEVEWLKIFNWGSFIQKFSKIEYIIRKTEEFLFENDDKKLTKLYFELKKKAQSKKSNFTK